MQADAADVDGARLAAQLEDLLDLLRRVVDPRHERRDQDAAGDALTVQLGDRLDPLARMRRVRLARPPGPLVERRNREIRREAGNLVDLLHEVEVAEQQRRLREHRRRRARVAHRLPDARHQLVAPLDPLVRIGVGPERDVLVLPRRPHQLRACDLGDVHLDDDLLLEVPVRVEVEVGVGGAGEAIEASMAASPVRIDRPAERHPRRLRHPVQRRLRADFIETSVERLGRVEGPDRCRLAVAGQGSALLGIDAQVVPAHEHMFAHRTVGMTVRGDPSVLFGERLAGAARRNERLHGVAVGHDLGGLG